MKAAGRRQKGARLERKICEMIRRSGLDKRAKRSFQSGAHWSWKSDIYTSLPFSIEAKWWEKMRLWKWLDQAEQNATVQKPAIVVHTANNRPILATMRLEVFLEVLKTLKDYENENN